MQGVMTLTEIKSTHGWTGLVPHHTLLFSMHTHEDIERARRGSARGLTARQARCLSEWVEKGRRAGGDERDVWVGFVEWAH